MKQEYIRNFAIIAHVDHGKSTLADRFLEITNTIQKEKMQEQFLDQNPISRERGITIKLAPVRMNYAFDGNSYMLNLIDTPGHMDFSYEVSRTLAACEGAILLVDSTQGIQAQTIAHFNSAKKENLVIVPAINKIDLESARVEETERSLIEAFGFKKEEIIHVSGKTGQNVEMLLKAIVKRIPAPKGIDYPLRALVFDAFYDEYRGVIAYVRIIDGSAGKRDRIKFIQGKSPTEVLEVGYFSPFLSPQDKLFSGEIGYIITGIKDLHKVRIGDTLTFERSEIKLLPGYKQPKPMVFFGVYPKTSAELIYLKEGLSKLALNDTSLEISTEHSAFLGNGFRAGFLGLLHAEIVKERLRREEEVDAIFTMPHVLYKKSSGGMMLEPYMNLTIYVPHGYVGSIMSVCQKRKGKMINISYGKRNVVIYYQMPYSMLMRGLAFEIKNVSSGFASLDYEVTDYREADIINLEIRVNNTTIDVLSEHVYKDEANSKAREKTEELRKTLPRRQFRQIIQAVVGSKILAREEILPFRKDVLAKMSGGDRRRKDKLLDRQKKGKERLMDYSKVDIPQEALLSLIKSY